MIPKVTTIQNKHNFLLIKIVLFFSHELFKEDNRSSYFKLKFFFFLKSRVELTGSSPIFPSQHYIIMLNWLFLIMLILLYHPRSIFGL